MRISGLLAASFAAAAVVAGEARAEDEARAPVARSARSESIRTDPFATKPGYVQLFGTVLGGTGLRFNNPYRLATPLGDTAESVSRTAGFVDVGIAATFANPLGLQHGLALRTTFAVEGVAQALVTPSYLAYRRFTSVAVWGRAGIPLVLTPDPTWGLEAAGGAAWFVRGGIGLAAELVGNLFYGAGTEEVRVATYPVLSVQLGVIVAYEVLP